MNYDRFIQLKEGFDAIMLRCSKGSVLHFADVFAGYLKEQCMTNIHLQQSVPVAISEKVTEVFSGLVLVLSGVLTLVTMATI